MVTIVAIATMVACSDTPENKEVSTTPLEQECDTLPQATPSVAPSHTPQTIVEESDSVITPVSCETPPLTTNQIITNAKNSIDNGDYAAAARAICHIDTTRMQEIFDNDPEAASEMKFILYTIYFSEDTQAIEALTEWDKMMTGTFGLQLTDGEY